MRKKTDPFLESWIDILVEKVLREQEPEQTSSPPKTKSTNATETGTSDKNREGSPDSSASPKTGSGPEAATPESEIPSPDSLPTDPSGIDPGAGISTSGGGEFAGPGLGGGGGSMNTDSVPPDDSLIQGEPEESEAEDEAKTDPKEQFKQDFATLMSSTKEIEEIKKFLKASLQDKNKTERDDWLAGLDDPNDPVIQKATKDLKKFFS